MDALPAASTMRQPIARWRDCMMSWSDDTCLDVRRPAGALRVTISPVTPLTVLADDESLFFQSVLEFAANEVGPHVRAMDEEAAFPPELIRKLFDLGVMGIEV